MAISKNFLLKGVRGTLGKQLVIREFFGKTILSNYPDFSNRKLSRKQILQNERMKKANVEVRRILNDEKKRAEAQVRLNVQRNRLRSALLSEVMLRMSKES